MWVGTSGRERRLPPPPLESAGLSVEQKLSGSHKALVEMQDVVAELLKTVPREHPATKVRACGCGQWSQWDPSSHHEREVGCRHCSGCLPQDPAGGSGLLSYLPSFPHVPEDFW